MVKDEDAEYVRLKTTAHPLHVLNYAYERADEEERKRISQGLEKLSYEMMGISIGSVLGIAGAVIIGYLASDNTASSYCEPNLVTILEMYTSMIGAPFLGAKVGELVYRKKHKEGE